MTNYEHIKSLSLDEMATYLIHNFNACANVCYQDFETCNAECLDEIRKWLESEVEE